LTWSVAVIMWPTFILAGAVGGLWVTTWRRAGLWLAASAVLAVLVALLTGEVLTVSLILANMLVGLPFGVLTRSYARFARRRWNSA
jgi:hypothetical protein